MEYERHGVLFGKNVFTENLDSALKVSADDMGWDVDFTFGSRRYYNFMNLRPPLDIRISEYRLSTQEEEILKMILTVYNPHSTSRLYIDTGPEHGNASDEEILEYLSKVSEHVNNLEAGLGLC